MICPGPAEVSWQLTELLRFFQTRLTVIDLGIIALGLFTLGSMLWFRLTCTGKRFLRRVDSEPIVIERMDLRLRFTGTLIEILPLLGILGTVWGLMNALFALQTVESPSISDIATHIAPALSSTFFGLSFAVIDLFVFNYLDSYINELIAWHEALSPEEAEALAAEGTPADPGAGSPAEGGEERRA